MSFTDANGMTWPVLITRCGVCGDRVRDPKDMTCGHGWEATIGYDVVPAPSPSRWRLLATRFHRNQS